MNKKLILTDCDGVLLNWENSFIAWMTEQGFNANPNDNSYDMHKRFGERKAKDLVVQFDDLGKVSSFTFSTTDHDE